MSGTSADGVARQYAAANARLADGPSPALVAMQNAYVAYVRAYGEAYPAEAHLLPDAWKGQRMPEFRAFQTAREAFERSR